MDTLGQKLCPLEFQIFQYFHIMSQRLEHCLPVDADERRSVGDASGGAWPGRYGRLEELLVTEQIVLAEDADLNLLRVVLFVRVEDRLLAHKVPIAEVVFVEVFFVVFLRDLVEEECLSAELLGGFDQAFRELKLATLDEVDFADRTFTFLVDYVTTNRTFLLHFAGQASEISLSKVAEQLEALQEYHFSF